MIYFADTSALLNGCYKDYPHLWVSPLIVMELENIKTSIKKDEHIKMLARKVIKDILFNIQYNTYFPSQKSIQKILNKYSFLENINDHQILAAAKLLQKDKHESVNFITSDGALYLAAKEMGIETCFYEPNSKTGYCGWKKVNPTEKEFVSLYSHPDDNIFNAKTNEFITIYEEDALKDIMFWDGSKYNNLKYKDIKDKTLGEEIKPLNVEQRMAFHLLQDNDIPVKLLIGNPGTGKDILMIMHAIDLIQRGIMDKIIFVRNLVPFKDAPEIGFLSGDMNEKISWGLGPLRSILGEEGLKMYQENGVIEAVNLGFIRGCSWDKTIIYVSEGQNISGGGYKLLVSRCGKGSQLWVNGDILQTDDKKFETNNGLDRLIHSLAGNPLFGMVKLMKTERSDVAELAAKI